MVATPAATGVSVPPNAERLPVSSPNQVCMRRVCVYLLANLKLVQTARRSPQDSDEVLGGVLVCAGMPRVTSECGVHEALSCESMCVCQEASSWSSWGVGVL